MASKRPPDVWGFPQEHLFIFRYIAGKGDSLLKVQAVVAGPAGEDEVGGIVMRAIQKRYPVKEDPKTDTACLSHFQAVAQQTETGDVGYGPYPARGLGGLSPDSG